jgi:hypothetical protein
VLETKNFVDNVNIKGGAALGHPPVFENFEEYEYPAFIIAQGPTRILSLLYQR